jgi:hypothetical protein
MRPQPALFAYRVVREVHCADTCAYRGHNAISGPPFFLQIAHGKQRHWLHSIKSSCIDTFVGRMSNPQNHSHSGTAAIDTLLASSTAES